MPSADRRVPGGDQVDRPPRDAEGANAKLVSAVKVLQSKVPAFRDAWVKHCEARKKEYLDPARHSPAFLKAFVREISANWLGQASEAFDVTAQLQSIEREFDKGGMLAAWRQFLSEKAVGHDIGTDDVAKFLLQQRGNLTEVDDSYPVKRVLGDVIKAGQRAKTEAGEDWKTKWASFVEAKSALNGGKVLYRDPLRHDVSGLADFISQVGCTEFAEEEWMSFYF